MASLISQQRITRFIQSRFSPIRSLTPEWLSSMMDSFEAGFLREFALIADTMERRDPMIQIVAPKRRKAIARYGYEIVTLEDSDAAQAHKETLEFFFANLTATNAINKNERGGFKTLVKQMGDAIGKRYAVHEIVWQPTPDGLTAEFRFAPLWFFENRTGSLRYLPQEGMNDGIELEDDGWMITTGDGIMIACAVCYMFKNLPLKDWLIYCERFGMPIPLGTTSATQGSQEWRNMEVAVESIMAGAAGVKNEGESIDLLETKGSGELPHPKLVELMDRYISALWRGSDLSTMSGEGGKTGASVQEDEGNILETDDTDTISETLQTQVARFVIRYAHGDERPLAKISVKTRPQQRDVNSEIAVDKFLLYSDFPLSINDIAARYNRTLPKKGEELLEPVNDNPDDPAEEVDADGRKTPSNRKGGAKVGQRKTAGKQGAKSSAEDKETVGNVRAANVAKSRLVDPVDNLTAKALQPFRNARVEDFRPFADRLRSILALDDDVRADAALRILREDLAAIARGVLSRPAVASVLAETMTASFFNGADDAAMSRERLPSERPANEVATAVPQPGRIVKRITFEHNSDGRVIAAQQTEESSHA